MKGWPPIVVLEREKDSFFFTLNEVVFDKVSTIRATSCFFFFFFLQLQLPDLRVL